MQKVFQTSSQAIAYELKTSKRARTMRLTVYRGGSVVLTMPPFMDASFAHRFLARKQNWLIRTLDRLRLLPISPALPVLPPFYDGRHRALELVASRLTHFNQLYGFSYKRVTIKRHRTLWGSCSRKGNLNFNYRILALPPELADYLIVHELCHLGEFSHSKKFWDLVARVIPDYAQARKRLKTVSVR